MVASVFGVDNRLRFFFDDPAAFRVLQSETGCLIAGSFALQVFARVQFPTADLDLYVPLQAGARLTDWMIVHGYRFTPRPSYFHRDTGVLLYAGQPGHHLAALEVPHT